MTLQSCSMRSLRRAVAATCTVGCLLASRAAPAQDFGGATWVDLVLDGNTLSDVSGDASGQSILDLVGTTGYSAVSVAQDASFLYLRMRIDGDPTQGAGFRSFGWGCGLDNDGVYSGCEYLVFVNGQSDRVELWDNLTSQGPVVGAPSDKADTLRASYPVASHARAVAAGAPNLGSSAADYFLEFAVPLAALALAGYDASEPLVAFCGSNTSGAASALATDCSSTSAGCAATTIAAIGSDPVLCGASGCATCNTNDRCGAACLPCANPTPVGNPTALSCEACTGDAGCGGPPPYCVTAAADPARGSCVACLTTEHCPDAELCDPITHSCRAGCDANDDCATPTPVCNTTMGLCVECTALDDSVFLAAGEVCDDEAGLCVECLDAGDCASPTPACDPATRTCVEGTADDDTECASDEVCDVSGRVCVGCVGDGDCAAPTPACDLATRTCVECTAANPSACTPGGEVCHTGTNLCVGCVDDGDCAVPTPACEPTAQLCVECTTTNDAACTLAAEVCDPDAHRCVECLGDLDCPGSRPLRDPATLSCVECTEGDLSACEVGELCDPGLGLCVGCLDDGDCSGPTPACDLATHGCVECTESNLSACSTGELCDPVTRSCVGCANDGDCGGPMSGRVCLETGLCADGCRVGGNGCPLGFICSSTDASVGICTVVVGSGGAAGGGGAAGAAGAAAAAGGAGVAGTAGTAGAAVGVGGAPLAAGAGGAAPSGGAAGGGTPPAGGEAGEGGASSTAGSVAVGGAPAGGSVASGGASEGGVASGGSPAGAAPQGGLEANAGEASARELSLEGGGCTCSASRRSVPAGWLLLVLPALVFARRRRSG